MPPPPAGEYDSVPVRRARRRLRHERAAAGRRSWAYPLVVVLGVVAVIFGLLRADQQLTARLIWTAQGAQFVTVAAEPDDGPADPAVVGVSSAPAGPRLVVVAGGLNRRDGTSIARALLPELLTPGTEVVSLVYGNAIVDGDIEAKFDSLLERVRPARVDFYGSSMGGDVVLNLAARLQRAIDERTAERVTAGADGTDAGDGPDAPSLAELTGVAQATASAVEPGRTDPGSAVQGDESTDPAAAEAAPVPVVGTVYLDCTPLEVSDVRAVNRTRADTLTALTEALHTDGGAGTRLVAEVLAQRSQWSRPSDGRWGIAVDGDDLRYKIRQVVRDKISNTGISTGLIKDQYGVIRRMDAPDVLSALSADTAMVYFLPENRAQDATVDVARVEIALRAARVERGLDVTIVPIPGGSHASAERTTDEYLAAMDRLGRADVAPPVTVITGLPD
ncbi:hypothetical protein JL107_03880 [Nakamurella flavida]|uniref:Alpha/beta hydrolase n=1 Tax=Nakamurella flavida TaxID=363630 RepID=A0A938YLR4_9ACTN|nr:hypothetical protein [Nakamurella flavida]MBM9475579.1 hypothetical protein [Nakamurella flavida]MDP9778145.1 pimeloyl-ACP methyl ester carboxylesterase [Nakamurella flavida]